MTQQEDNNTPNTQKAVKHLTVSLRDRTTITGRLAKHFGIKKDDLKASTEMEQDVLYYPDLDDKEFYWLIYAGHLDKKIMFDHLFYEKKFLKSWLYEAFQDAQAQVPMNRTLDVLITFKMGEWLMVAYQSPHEYEGLGGILLKTKEGSFTIEPFDNFLNHMHPLPESE